MNKFLWIFLALVSCSSISKIDTVKPAAHDEQIRKREMLVGKWYGENTTKDGQFRKTLMNRKLDGTYVVKFQIFRGGKKALEQIENGFWGFAGGVYFTIAREGIIGPDKESFDMSNPDFYDAYEILDLEMMNFKYKNLDTHSIYSVRRVSDGFELP